MQFKTLQQAMIAAMKAREKERKEAISAQFFWHFIMSCYC